MDYASVLSQIRQETTPFRQTGQVTSFIPELQRIDPDKFGMHLATVEGGHFSVGDSDEKFSIQSISKVLSLSLAFTFLGEKIWERVGVEPSGSAFNSLVQLEFEKGKPRNPFINAGALVIADMLVSHFGDPKTAFLDFVRTVSGCPGLDFNARVAQSEKTHGFRNAALVNMLKSYGNIENEVEKVLDFYFHQCAVEMSCRELAQSFLFLANGGKLAHTGKEILTASQTKRLNAVMLTCGFYDEAGEFSYKVGLPGKSGIGGGIAAVHPKHYAVATWGPRLNEKGNSVLGMKSLELLTTKTAMSIF